MLGSSANLTGAPVGEPTPGAIGRPAEELCPWRRIASTRAGPRSARPWPSASSRPSVCLWPSASGARRSTPASCGSPTRRAQDPRPASCVRNLGEPIVGDTFMGLITEAADGTPIPGAAESWQVSDDGLVYTFKLRDHTWSDGVPVTADDFVYRFHRILDPKLAAEYASLLYPIKNAEAVNDGDDRRPGRARRAGRIDPKTLEITLESPTAYFLELLTHYTAFPVPQARDREVSAPTGSSPATSSATGPSRSSSGRPTPRSCRSRTPKFYDAANVKLDKVIYYPDEERNAVDQALPRRRDRLCRRLRLRADRLPEAGAARTRPRSRPTSAPTTT